MLDKIIKVIWKKTKRLRISREILKRGRDEWGIVLPDVKLYFKKDSHESHLVLVKNWEDKCNRLDKGKSEAEEFSNKVFDKVQNTNYLGKLLFDENC